MRNYLKTINNLCLYRKGLSQLDCSLIIRGRHASWVAYALTGLLMSSCATIPLPSEFAGALWYDGRQFVATKAWVRNGQFVTQPRQISEIIPLDGLRALAIDGGSAPRIGEAADFDLYAGDPSAGAQPVARVRGGKLVKAAGK